MNVLEAIINRKSIRAFTTQPVSKAILNEILGVAVRAPSMDNSQPWEFYVIGHAVMEKVKCGLAKKQLSGELPHPEIPICKLPERYIERSRENGKRLFELLDIERDNKEKRKQWALTQARSFDAPNGIIICISKELSTWSILDVGIVMQNIMLAAHYHGLGTCAQGVMVSFPEVLRRELNIPKSKLIVCGIAIGYPDQSAKVNMFRSHRVALDELVNWYGFNED